MANETPRAPFDDTAGTHVPSRRDLFILAGQLAFLAACTPLPTLKEKPMTPSSEHDFDFLIGSWRVFHQRLRERLAGNDEWQEFDGTCTMHTLLGGQGNVDDNVMNLPGGTYRGVGLRSFDPATRRWAIWWLDSRTAHTIDTPVIGSFDNGVGSFYADESFNGKPIRVRFRWTHTHTASPHWEQAFSPDGGATWEVNWKMRFVRVTAGASGTASRTASGTNSEASA